MPVSDAKPRIYICDCTFDSTGGHCLTIVDHAFLVLAGSHETSLKPAHSIPHFLEPSTPPAWVDYFRSADFKGDIKNRLVTVEVGFSQGEEPNFKITVWKSPPGGGNDSGSGEGGNEGDGDEDGGGDREPTMSGPGKSSARNTEEEDAPDAKPDPKEEPPKNTVFPKNPEPKKKPKKGPEGPSMS